MLLTNNLNKITMKERGDISTYFMEVMDIKNHLNAFGKTIIDKTLINIVLNGLLQSYEMVI